MNAVDFLKAKDEICTSYECRRCPLGEKNNSHGKSCDALMSLYPDEAVNIVGTWVKNHPDVISIHYIAKDNVSSSYTTLITEAKNFEQRDYGEYWEVKK